MEFLVELVSRLRAAPAILWRDLRPQAGWEDSTVRKLRRNFIYHLHPLRVSERALRPTTTFGLGLLSLTLFFILFGTGLLLMLYYVPTPREAYASMLDIEHAVTLGGFVRRLHRAAAHAMVAVVGLHLVRILAQAAYRRRELNWLIGIGLVSLLVGLAFTGYLLPWDQTSYWAVRVVANMLEHIPGLGRALEWLVLGGANVGAATLVRFYALHVAILPFLMLGLAALHLWRVRRDGGLATSVTEAPTVSAWPHLVLRVGLVMLAATTALVVLALLVDAPLGPPADVLRPANPEKAPWYFLGMQEMVSYSSFVGGVVFPSVLGLVLLLVPTLDRDDVNVGVWLGGSRSRRFLAVDATLSVLVIVGGLGAFLSPAAGELLGRQVGWVRDLTNPATLALVWTAIIFLAAGQATGSMRSALRSALAALALAVILFTAVALCRGPDWAFYWPWQEWTRVR
jgi:quinol-cytochrome oxidoreductase complex cytochrome b subunit